MRIKQFAIMDSFHLSMMMLASLVPSPDSFATSVLPLSMERIAQEANLIFEGSVLHAETIAEPDGQIFTEVTFRIKEILAGTHSQKTLVLRFLGGRRGERLLRVNGMQYPQHGETGIYFVEDPTRALINPLLGWDQGRFLTHHDPKGKPRVTTAAGRPVLELAQSPSHANLSAGSKHQAALGLLLGAPHQLGEGITVDELKHAIRLYRSGSP